MQITIDTKHDSHEDLKKVIALLSQLVGKSQKVSTNWLDTPRQEDSYASIQSQNNYINPLAQNRYTEQQAVKNDDQPVPPSGFFNMFESEVQKAKEQEKKEELNDPWNPKPNSQFMTY